MAGSFCTTEEVLGMFAPSSRRLGPAALLMPAPSPWGMGGVSNLNLLNLSASLMVRFASSKGRTTPADGVGVDGWKDPSSPEESPGSDIPVSGSSGGGSVPVGNDPGG